MKRFDQAWLVAKRELIDQMRDWRILLPMIILTIFFPYLMNVAAKTTVDYINRYGANLIAERLLPFLILVVGYFPVTVSLVVALESFVGEKEHRLKTRIVVLRSSERLHLKLSNPARARRIQTEHKLTIKTVPK